MIFDDDTISQLAQELDPRALVVALAAFVLGVIWLFA